MDHHARGLGVDAVTLGIGRRGAVARRVGGGHLGVDHLVPIGHQVATRHIDAESLVGQDQTGEGLAIDGQGDGVALFHVATHATGHGDVLLGLGRVDHIVRGDVAIQGDAGIRWSGIEQGSVVGGAGRVARRVGNAGHHGQVAIRQPAQIGAGLVVAVGIGDGSDCHALTSGIADHQGHGAVRADIGGAADGRVGHIGRVHVIQAHRDVRRGVHATIVARRASVASRISHAGSHVIAPIWQRRHDIRTVTAIRLYRGGQGLLIAVGIGHRQGHRAAGGGVRGPRDGRGVVIGIVRCIHRHDRSRTVHAAIIGRGAGVAGRIGHGGRHLIAPFGQRCGDIHAEAAIRLHRRGQGLLIAVGIGHNQGHRAASGGIRGTGQGRRPIVGVVGGRDCDDGSGEVDQLILAALRIHQRRRASRVRAVKACAGDGCITGTIDSDETAVAAGTSHAPRIACGRGSTRRRRFECLGGVGSVQNRLLQGGDVIGRTRVRQHGVTLFGALAGTQGERSLPSLEAGPFGRKQYRILGQYIAFCNESLAPVGGDQIHFALQVGNDDILIQYDALIAHGFS